MNDPASLIELLFEKVEAYSITTYHLAKLKSLEVATIVITTLVSNLVVLSTLAMFLLILNIGIAIWIGELLGKYYYGFFVVAAFYLVAGLVMNFFLHSWIKKPLTKLIIEKALD